MSAGPVFAALTGDPVLAEHYAAFRARAEGALDARLVALVRQAIAAVHGIEAAAIDDAALDERTRVCVAYARRIPFEHTAITDAEAAAMVAHLGEPRFVAFSVVAALADAECRAELVGLADLAASSPPDPCPPNRVLAVRGAGSCLKGSSAERQ